MESFQRRPKPGVIQSYTDGALFKDHLDNNEPAIHVALYADEADPMNPLGSFCFFCYAFTHILYSVLRVA